jgi:hypothetical protein
MQIEIGTIIQALTAVGSILGAYIAVRVSITKIETIVEERDKLYTMRFNNMEKDINGLGTLYRNQIKNSTKELES